MKKTMYIPKGQTCLFESVTCENLVVKGSLRVLGVITAKNIRADGLLSANVISCETLIGNVVDAGTIITDTLVAKRVTAIEIRAVQSMAVSSYVEADLVKTGKLTIADAEIADLQSDEVIKLAVKRRGLLGTLFASFIRSKWIALTCRNPQMDFDCSVDDGLPVDEAELPENEALPVEVSPEIEEAMHLMDDPEFLRLKAMYKLTKETGDIWQIIPKKEPTNRAVTYAHPFDVPDEKIAA